MSKSITEALGECIEASGGTPTAEDEKSVSHALGTLYESLGGTGALVNDVAQRVSSLSAVIGGGSSLAYKTAKVIVVNSTGSVMNVLGLQIVTDNGEVAVTNNSLALTKNMTKEIQVPVYRPKYSQDKDTNESMCEMQLHVRKTVASDPSKVIATATEGTVGLIHVDSDDANRHLFVLLYNGVSVTGVPTITISVTA